MTDIDDVVTAAASVIATGLGSDIMAGRVYAYGIDSPNSNSLFVLPGSGSFLTFDATFDGHDDYELVLKIIMGAQDDRTGQQALLGYLSRSGSTSIRTAIYTDPTLGGIVSDLTVTGASGYGDIEWAGQVFFGADLLVSVLG